jgi:cell division protein FtsI/penicillin-binding protein 2/cell division protein FtsW (lipid II flippase)
MQVLVNYVMIILLIIFSSTALIDYKTKKHDVFQDLVILKVILITMCIIGHMTVFYSTSYSSRGFILIGLNLLIILVISIGSHLIPYFEPLIWHIVLMLHLIGSIMLHRLQYQLALKHNYYALIGFVFMVVVTYIIKKFKYMDKLAIVFMVLSILLLIITNSTANGSKNWFSFRGFSFQPSEVVKILFTLYLAAIFRKSYKFKTLMIGTVFSAFIVVILVWQRDLGSAFLFFSLYMVLSYMYSRKRWMSFLQLGGLFLGAVSAYFMFDHIKTRILAWHDPFSYIDKQGYQITQSLFAFANGKWLGTGLLKGMPGKIPVVTTDFIFAAIGEEFGSIFALTMILLYLLLIIVLLTQAQKTTDLFNAYVGVGLVVMLGLQGFLIMAGVVKLIPLTGVTLPFVSYGGSSLISTFLLLGVIEAITKKKRHAEHREYREHTIVTIKVVMTLVYSILFGYVLFVIAFQADELQINQYNPRLEAIEKGILRGTIYDRDLEVLAYSQINREVQTRIYPFSNEFAHVVGYSQVGKTGLEAYHNVDLLNSHLTIFEQIGRTFDTTMPSGSDVYTTLDEELQKIAYKELGNRKGAIIAIEPSTGKLLAMVSKPDYNPNDMVKLYKDLIKDDQATLLNRGTNGLYAPGSTFKVLTLLEYIRENGEAFAYTCKAVEQFRDKQIRCYGHTSHGDVDLREALAQSCNTAFATMGEKIDMHKLKSLTEDALYNTSLPYRYNHSKSSFEVPDNVLSATRVETVIGQGKTLITPLHNVLMISALANEGRLMTPYLVEKVVSPTGRVIEMTLPKENRQLFSKEEAFLLTDYMTEVVLTGTAKELNSTLYTAAGKTGAAENDFGPTHAWFIGFAPVENPQIAVVILVENAGSSRQNSVPIAKKMFDYYLIDSIKNK